MEKVNVNRKSVKNRSSSREGTMKLLLKNFHEYLQVFQIPGLRKMNMANAESIFDQHECDI